MTDAEFYQLYGTLSRHRIEGLLDMSDGCKEQSGAIVHIEEADCCFPPEDFLQPILERLQALEKRMRGTSKEEVRTIINDLEELQASIWREGEHGSAELLAARNLIYVP